MSKRKKSKNLPAPQISAASRENILTRFLMRKTYTLEPEKKPVQIPWCLLGFIIPFLCTWLAMVIRKNALLADNPNYVFSLLYSDAYFQYYPFFVDFRNTLLSGESLLYTWNIAMGTDYLGLFAYYVASPLNLLSVLIPEGQLLDFYSLLVPIRVGFAGLFFSIFLKNVFKRNEFTVALFGSFYATCAWVTGYMWNTMWLDTFALLPLVALGTVYVLRDRKFALYTVSLFLSVYINYYIGFFTCIFTLLVFICYEVSRWKDVKKLLTDLGLMAAFTVLALGMTAFLTLPAYASLMTTSAGGSSFPKEMELHIAKEQTFGGFLEAMIRVSANNLLAIPVNSKSRASAGGMPNIYCGVFAAGLAFLFFTCKQVKWRERICALVMLLFLNASFIIVQLDYIWHGFHETNEIPNRFSFLYSFVVLYLAYRVWLMRRRLQPWQILTGLCVSMIGLFVSPGMEAFEGLTEGQISVAESYPLINVIFLLVYYGALLGYTYRQELPRKAKTPAKRKWYRQLHLRRQGCSLVLVFAICIELVANTAFMSMQIPEFNAYGYPRKAEDTAKAVAFMKEKEGDGSFYRAETAQHNSYNDGMLNNYNGISTFSSAANANVTTFLRAMGVSGAVTYNRFVCEEVTPVTNMFLNLKYIIERRNFVEPNPYLTDVFQSGTVHLLENNHYLPIGFMVDPQMADLSFQGENGTFEFQNRLVSKATGQTLNLWMLDSAYTVDISMPDGSVRTLTQQQQGGWISCSANAGDVMRYTFRIEQEGYFSLRLDMPGKNAYVVELNGKKLHDETHNGLPHTSAICQVSPGDQVEVAVTCKSGTNHLDLQGAVLDGHLMEQAYRILSRETLTVTDFSDTHIEGTISCEKPGLLYTSIPQNNDNWHAFVDGEPAQITLIGGAMVGVMLTEGTHAVTFCYENDAFTTGCVISITAAMIFLSVMGTLCVIKTRRKRKPMISAPDENLPDV